jgi:hypothetical protein
MNRLKLRLQEITDQFRGIYRISPNSIKENWSSDQGDF